MGVRLVGWQMMVDPKCRGFIPIGKLKVVIRPSEQGHIIRVLSRERGDFKPDIK